MSKNLHPTMAAFLAPFAPPRSVVHTVAAEAEARAIQADLAYLAMKNNGALLRHQIDQAHHTEIQHGDHE